MKKIKIINAKSHMIEPDEKGNSVYVFSGDDDMRVHTLPDNPSNTQEKDANN